MFNKKLSLLFPFCILIIGLFSCSKEETPDENPIETLTDVDGNTYNTIKVGEQIWMLENLKTTKFNDGTPISEYEFGMDWHNGNEQMAFYQWADTGNLNGVHDSMLPFDYYGAMYNHFAMESGKLAPVGWRIPTVDDFLELEKYLTDNGYSGMEALALKTDSGWLDSSGNGINAIGFNALPNGYINAFGGPTLGDGICTWATTELHDDGTRTVINLFDEDVILYARNGIQLGAGIRCIKE